MADLIAGADQHCKLGVEVRLLVCELVLQEQLPLCAVEVCVEGCAPDVCMAACDDSALACWETEAGD